ncbi:MAG: FKBP-type peptidyl-prolyl cis-trans isomerase [Tannerella sp.]|jgi:FKBP-type peptidyl-prolyl cis-trans isomerase|nr:FKBP-type peptidyl-prolyl cis-trans isomerase [Tannerella sp.]
MKKNIVLFVAIAIVAGATSCRTGRQAAVEAPQAILLNSLPDSVSYAIGLNYGASLRENMKVFPGGEYSLDALAEGFAQGIRGDSALAMTPEAAPEFIQAYLQRMMEKEAEAEKEKGDAFLAENKNRDGVITTESGLQYMVVVQGDGPIPAAENQVKVHYTGKLMDGTVFDSSVERGEPAIFGVTQVIRGWAEILQRMPVGSKYTVWIPSELAYGAQGAGQTIRPNSMLEFEIELIEIADGTAVVEE